MCLWHGRRSVDKKNVQLPGASVVGLEVSGRGGKVAAQPGRVEPHRLESLLHGALGARRLVRSEELLDLLRGGLRREVLRRRLHQPRQQEATLSNFILCKQGKHASCLMGNHQCPPWAHPHHEGRYYKCVCRCFIISIGSFFKIFIQIIT